MSQKVTFFLSAILVNIVLVSFMFSIHYFFPSILNNLHHKASLPWHHIDNEYMSTWWGFHYGHPVFAGRPVTTFITGLVIRVLPIGIGTSFVLVNFGALFISGVLIYLLSRLYAPAETASLSHRRALLSSLLFFTTYSVLFAFFRPISSFDEPLQYVWVLLTLISIYYKRYSWALLTLVLAVLTRETTTFLYFGLALLVMGTLSPKKWWEEFKGLLRRQNENTPLSPSRRLVGTSSQGGNKKSPLEGGRGVFNSWKDFFCKLTLFIVPILIYSLVIPQVLKSRGVWHAAGVYLSYGRWNEWRYNVHNFQYFFESLISAFAVIGLPLFCVILYKKFFSPSEHERKLMAAGLITMSINTPIVFITAYAQEARLFALPLLFLWPLLGTLLTKLCSRAWQNMRQKLLVKILLLGLSLLLWYLVAFRFFQPTFSGGSGWLYQTYVFIELSLISFLLIGTYKSSLNDQGPMTNVQSNPKP